MKKYSILSLLSIVLLAGCSFLPQSTENPIEQPQVFSGVWWTVPSDDGKVYYPVSWTLQTESTTDTGYIYIMNIDDALAFSFKTAKEINTADIIPGEFQNARINIPSIPLVIGGTHRYNPLLGTVYSFRATFSGNAEILCTYESAAQHISFPSGSGELFVKGRFSADKTYPYINHFLTTIPLPMLANVFPGEWSKTFDRKSDINPHHRGKDDCLIEIGTREQITKDLPIQFSTGFDGYTFAVSKEKSASSNCRALMDKDLQMVFYTGNNKIDQSDYWYCSLKTNLPTSLKEITPLELSAIR